MMEEASFTEMHLSKERKRVNPPLWRQPGSGPRPLPTSVLEPDGLRTSVCWRGRSPWSELVLPPRGLGQDTVRKETHPVLGALGAQAQPPWAPCALCLETRVPCSGHAVCQGNPARHPPSSSPTQLVTRLQPSGHTVYPTPLWERLEPLLGKGGAVEQRKRRQKVGGHSRF